MGNSSSKGAHAVGRAAAKTRQYPTSPSLPTPAPRAQQQQQQQPPDTATTAATTTTTSAVDVDLDARDRQFAASLSRLGAVRRRDPAHVDYAPPTGPHVFPASRSPTVNPAIAIVNARDRIARQFAQECEDLGSRSRTGGRSLLSAKEIREVIAARDQGRGGGGGGGGGDSNSAIEQRFHLKRGLLADILSGGAVKNVS